MTPAGFGGQIPGMDLGPIYRNRADGGRALAEALATYKGLPCVVYGLPRGGVATAAEVARFLGAPLDLIVAKKIGYPFNPEFAVGAVAETGETVLSEELRQEVGEAYLEQERARRLAEAREKRAKYLGERPPTRVEGKTAILVDDGIATGYTMKAALLALRKRNPARVVVAAPVAPLEAIDEFRRLADEVVVCHAPSVFLAIGHFYEDFSPVEDDEVARILSEVKENAYRVVS